MSRHHRGRALACRVQRGRSHRGPYWNYATDFASNKYDEWGIGFERKFDFPASLQTTTIRNNVNQFALPARRPTFPIQYHSLGFGVGGVAQHYGGNMGRQARGPSP